MALILNLETATTQCSVSLSRQGKVVALREENHQNYSHAEQLHPFIKEVLESAGEPMSALQAVAVSKGPGSYTGLRIGVSAAKGLCYALGIPLISIPTLDSLAAQLSHEQGVRIPMLDARRMEVYAKVLDPSGQELLPTRAEVLTETSFTTFLDAPEVHFLGSGAAKCKELFTGANHFFHETLLPSAREMAGISWQKYQAGDFEDVAYFEPFYLKDFIAHKKKKA